MDERCELISLTHGWDLNEVYQTLTHVFGTVLKNEIKRINLKGVI